MLFLLQMLTIQTAPLIQRIANKTQIGFEVVGYNDRSPCVQSIDSKVIDTKTIFAKDFLLERDHPGLVLRPIYYIDSQTGKKVDLVDEQKHFDSTKIAYAYKLWKMSGNKKKFANAQDWFNRWVGSDIQVRPYTSEVVGYLINLSRIQVTNTINKQGTWLSFAKGVFAKLVLEIDIDQHSRKGIIPTAKVVAGEGGICTNGIVERL